MAGSKSKRKKPGPPKKPASELSRTRSTSLPPHVDDFLAKHAGGSASRGLRIAALALYETHKKQRGK